jgi:Fe-S-cluster formation regulator IscX/YfhJ
MTTTTQRRYTDIDQIRRANQDAGQHWFDPSTMRFFSSRVGHAVYGGKYFVSSEQFDYNSPRLYTVRFVDERGWIDEVGEFQQYPSHAAAVRAIRKLIAEEGN